MCAKINLLVAGDGTTSRTAATAKTSFTVHREGSVSKTLPVVHYLTVGSYS